MKDLRLRIVETDNQERVHEPRPANQRCPGRRRIGSPSLTRRADCPPASKRAPLTPPVAAVSGFAQFAIGLPHPPRGLACRCLRCAWHSLPERCRGCPKETRAPPARPRLATTSDPELHSGTDGRLRAVSTNGTQGTTHGRGLYGPCAVHRGPCFRDRDRDRGAAL
jgi:hypothetical protein